MTYEEAKEVYEKAREVYEKAKEVYEKAEERRRRCNFDRRGNFERGFYEVDDYGMDIHIDGGFVIPIPMGTHFYNYIKLGYAKIVSVAVYDRVNNGYDGFITLEITSHNRNYPIGTVVIVSFFTVLGRPTYMTNDLLML